MFQVLFSFIWNVYFEHCMKSDDVITKSNIMTSIAEWSASEFLRRYFWSCEFCHWISKKHSHMTHSLNNFLKKRKFKHLQWNVKIKRIFLRIKIASCYSAYFVLCEVCDRVTLRNWNIWIFFAKFAIFSQLDFEN